MKGTMPGSGSRPWACCRLAVLLGNMAMGVLFGWLFLRWGRVMPLIVAHALIDIVAFLGYALLDGRVDWLPAVG